MTAWMMLLWRWMTSASHPTMRRFSWGVAGGSITGLQNFLKDALTIAKSKEIRQMLPLVLVFIGLAIFVAFTGLLFLTACMKRYDATYSSAMFVGSFVVSASIMSAIHYSTFRHLDSVVNYVMYPLGLLVLMGGVYLLVREAGVVDGDDFIQLDRRRSSGGSSYHHSSPIASREQSMVPMRDSVSMIVTGAHTFSVIASQACAYNAFSCFLSNAAGTIGVGVSRCGRR